MSYVRMPAVSGLFYTSEAKQLEGEIRTYLNNTLNSSVRLEFPSPKALIVPHAGYIYSGIVAAAAYNAIEPSLVSRIVLLGPSHKIPLKGIALSSAAYFRTPFGDVATDQADFNTLLELPYVEVNDQAHTHEHSLEVQIPFLQAVLGGFNLLPVVVGVTAPADVALFLDNVWGGDETLIIVSSDLSHYHHYQEASCLDRETGDKILRFDTDIKGEEACGCYAVNGLLYAAKKRRLRVKELAMASSGDTAGDKERVVGYGSYAFG